DLYVRRLLSRGTAVAEDQERMKNELRDRLDRAYALAKESRPRQSIVTLGGVWKGFTRAGTDWSARTAVSADLIRKVAEASTSVPPDSPVHPKHRGLPRARGEMGQGKVPVDWGAAEALARGTLVIEGTPVRFVGQDAQRGPFSHRHACLHDYNTGQKWY